MRISKAAREAARETGRIGGKTRAKNQTPEQRRESARRAGLASAKVRWGTKSDATSQADGQRTRAQRES